MPVTANSNATNVDAATIQLPSKGREQFERFVDALSPSLLARLGFSTERANYVLVHPVPVFDALRDHFEPLAQVVMSIYPDTLTEECVFRNALQAVLQLRSERQEPNSADVQMAFDTMIESIEDEIHNYTAVVPIENLRLEVPELRVGDVVIVSPTDCRLDIFRSHFDRYLQENHLDFKYVQSFAVLFVRAQGERAVRVAITKVKGTLNVLRLFIGGIKAHDLQILREVGLIGETGALNGRYVFLTHQYTDDYGSGTGGIVHSIPRSPGLKPVLIDAEVLAFLKENGLPYLEKVLASRYKDEHDVDRFQTKLYRAITWFGKGICASADDEKFVSYMIALETLLIDRDTRIRGPLADRLSSLLSADPTKREELARFTKKLYDERSGIVHGGGRVESMVKLEALTRQVILKVASEGISTFDELLQWIQTRNRR